ncbi:MAG: ArnT family glycosyltransferase [Armatimonadota bacterium]
MNAHKKELLGRVGWPETVLLVLAVLVIRIIYLVWLSQWELLGDEAHYWEWSRRPSLSYYSKGPGVAWLIAASTALFGASEWAVRLPAAIASAVGALALARLTNEITGDERAGFLAAGAFFLIPIFQLEAQVMTIDPPFMASWIICAWIAWHAFRAHERGESRRATDGGRGTGPRRSRAISSRVCCANVDAPFNGGRGTGPRRSRAISSRVCCANVDAPFNGRRGTGPRPTTTAAAFPWHLWALLGLAMGVGFLIKYVIVLLAPGLVIYALLRRRELPWDGRLTAGIVVALIGFTAAISPWIAWNAENGWPAIRHELGHLGAPGGDVPPQWHEPHGVSSMLELLAAQVGVFGPPAFVLMVMATVRAIRRRAEEPARRADHAFLLSAGLPTIAFFVLLSLVTGVEANWPASGYLTLMVLMAGYSSREWVRWRAERGTWRERAEAAREAGTAPPRPPRNAWVRGWRWVVGWGLVTATIIGFPHAWERVPVLGDALPMQRIEGARELAARVDALREELRERTGEEPLVIAARYDVASQLEFYLDGRPVTYGAGKYVGRRESQYDYWPDTDLTNAALHGRAAILVLQKAESWQSAFEIRGLETVGGDPPVHVAEEFLGPRE